MKLDICLYLQNKCYCLPHLPSPFLPPFGVSPVWEWYFRTHLSRSKQIPPCPASPLLLRQWSLPPVTGLRFGFACDSAPASQLVCSASSSSLPSSSSRLDSATTPPSLSSGAIFRMHHQSWWLLFVQSSWCSGTIINNRDHNNNRDHWSTSSWWRPVPRSWCWQPETCVHPSRKVPPLSRPSWSLS